MKETVMQKTFWAGTPEELDKVVNEFATKNNIKASQVRVGSDEGSKPFLLETVWYTETPIKEENIGTGETLVIEAFTNKFGPAIKARGKEGFIPIHRDCKFDEINKNDIIVVEFTNVNGKKYITKISKE